MFLSKLVYFVIFITNLHKCHCKISDKRLCVDDQCSVPVSLAKTVLKYSSPEKEVLSFSINEDVTIFSKEAGSVLNLWGAEIKGKRGYIPKHLVREYKILKKPLILVDTKIPEPEEPQKINEVKPNKPLEPFEIIDGTKLYVNSDNVSITSEPTKISPQQNLKDSDVNTLKPNNNEKPNEIDNTQVDDSNAELIEKATGENSTLVKESNLNNDEIGSIMITNTSSVEDDEKIELGVDQIDLAENNSLVSTADDVSAQETNSFSAENQPVSKEQVNLKEVNVAQIDETSVPMDSTESKLATANQSTSGYQHISEDKPIGEEQPTSKNQPTSENQHTSENQPASEIKAALEEPPTSGEKPISENKGTPENQINSESQYSNEQLSSENQSSVENDLQNSNTQENSKITFSQNSDKIDLLESKLAEDDIQKAATSKIVENSNSKIENIEVHSPPPLLPIFSPFSSNINNPATPSSDAEIKEENSDNTERENKEIVHDHGFLQDLDSKENNSEELEGEYKAEQNSLYFTEDMSRISAENMMLDSREEDGLSQKIEDLSSEENIFDKSAEHFDKTSQKIDPPDVSNTEELPSRQQEETATQKEIIAPNKNVDNEVAENLNEEESAGIFSVFTNLFEWFSSGDQTEKNSAVDNIMPIREDHLKCEANNGVINNTDFLSFGPNNNIVIYLITLVVMFITFLVFYLSFNKLRIEAPLVYKINQLEKDLLIMMKEKESLTEQREPPTELKYNPIESEQFLQVNQKLQEMNYEKEDLEMQFKTLKEALEKKDIQIENLEKELETSTEVGMELNRIISEMLDPSASDGEKLKENVEQLQKQLQEQRGVIKNMNARLNAKEVENAEMVAEVEEKRKNASVLQQRIQELVERVTSIEREKDAQQNTLQNEIRLYQTSYNKAIEKEEALNNEIQILRSKLTNTEREVDIKIKECNSLKESFKNITSMKNDKQKLNSVLDTITIKAEYDQMKLDIEKMAQELKYNQNEKTVLEKNYQSILHEIDELKKKYQETDKEKVETDLKLNVLNNYFKKREGELQEEVLKYKAIWDAKKGEATSTTERIKLLQEEIENYKTQNEVLKQEILSQELSLKSQISVLEKKAHENWVNARQTERKLEDARQEAAQLRNRLTFQPRNINEEILQNGLEQNDSTLSSQPTLYSPASPLFYDNVRDQVTKSPLPGLPPFLPPPPGAPFGPPPVPNLSGMPLPHFMPPLPAGFPGDHRPPPLGRMSSPPIKSRYSPDTSAFSPYERVTPSPVYDSEYGDGGHYRNYSPYNSEDDRRMGYKSPSPLNRTKARASKNSLLSSGVNRSNESLEKTNSKKSNMV